MATRIRRPFLLSFLVLVCAFPAGSLLLSNCSSPRDTYPADPDSMFIQVVAPTLRRECEGCHFPGGNFYNAFPFDEDRIVRDRLEEILIRLPEDARDPLQYWASLPLHRRGDSTAAR